MRRRYLVAILCITPACLVALVFAFVVFNFVRLGTAETFVSEFVHGAVNQGAAFHPLLADASGEPPGWQADTVPGLRQAH